MNLNFLDFERPIAELEAKIEELQHVSDDGLTLDPLSLTHPLNTREQFDQPGQLVGDNKTQNYDAG